MWFLLLGLGVVAVAALSRPSVTDDDVQPVVNHALLAESDPNVLRTLQYALSNAGEFKLAETVKARADALAYEVAQEIKERVEQSTAYADAGPVIIQATPAPVSSVSQFMRF